MTLDLNDAKILFWASEKPDPLVRPEMRYCVAPVYHVVPFCDAIRAAVLPTLRKAGREVKED